MLHHPDGTWDWIIRGKANGGKRKEWSEELKKHPMDPKNPGWIKHKRNCKCNRCRGEG